jgi:excinuclease UvrABC helicase subunit UvrB
MTKDRQKQQQEYLRQHTLTPQDLRRMIAEKLERARAFHLAKLKREALQENR